LNAIIPAMSKYIAFLRAMNVGGHTVKMDALRQLFESLGFSNVETFIASGNVIFEANAGNTKSLEKKIETCLLEALGYEVATFIRTDAEVAEIAKYKPFPQSQLDTATALNIGFLTDCFLYNKRSPPGRKIIIEKEPTP